MERKRFSVLFFIKRSKLLKNGEAPVRVRVTYDRLYVELQLKRSVKVPLWSQEKEKSTGKTEILQNLIITLMPCV